ncbi:MAG: hypothetical protein JNG86_19980, partial [Verrucomicrobiaceae bacterium]|nr:hypothetical protein [Verrucomicrobiaceae bacterium]
MKTNLLLSILVTALLASCGRSQKTDTAAPDRTPPDKVGKVPAEEPPISQPLPPSNLPIQWATSPNAKMTIIERIPFGSAHSTKEEVEEFVKGMDNPNLYHAIISVQPMMGKRTPEGMKAMMQLLKEQLDQLPVTAPSSQEFEAAEKSLGQSIEASRNKHFLTTFRKAQKLAACLVGYGV